MNDFIELSDYDSTLHVEILDSLVRSDETIIEQVENDVVTEMKGYLSARYDVEKIFSKVGAERNSLILMYAKDIVVYHLFCIHNPYKMSAIRKERYERAMEWLKAVAKGEIMIDGADKLDDDTAKQRSIFAIISNPMRNPHY